jgi:hypothetical protein
VRSILLHCRNCCSFANSTAKAAALFYCRIKIFTNIYLLNDLFPGRTSNLLEPKLVQIIFKNSARTSKKTQHFTITKINRLILFKEITKLTARII